MKGQMAVETLLIYGITILIVMLAIGALIGFGVLDIGGVLPDKCEFKPGQFTCSDFAANADSNLVQVEITSQVGKTVDSIRIDNVAGASACTDAVTWPTTFSPGVDANTDGDVDDPGDARGDPWVNGDSLLVEFDCPGLAGGAKSDLTFDLVYRLLGKDLDHPVKAEVKINTRE